MVPTPAFFVARGQAPYRVAWGSTRVQPGNVNDNQLLPNLSNNNITNENMISTAIMLIWMATRLMKKMAES
ncbi:MAG: DUF3999 domain-containing protein [gamma proteobacterium symbiont of Taylorina sp.]|nr:DUF3999 domain-containing protein [gamma proteobacterium symbiont of Taylorina sp.]